MTFAVTVTFKLQTGRQAEFDALVTANAAASLREEAGCRQFDVLTDPARPDEVFLYELYDDEAAFALHKQTTHFKSFDAAVSPMIAAKTVATYRRVVQ